MTRMLRSCLFFAGLGILTAIFALDMVSTQAPRASKEDTRISQAYRQRNYRHGGSYGRGARSIGGGIPGGRTYYNGRYYGNYNNRFYGPQYGYF
jgi:hypothetical protein